MTIYGPRTRTKTFVPIVSSGHVTTTSFNGNCSVPDQSTVLVNADRYWTSRTQSLSMTDVVTEGYKRRIAKGEIINNPMSKFSEVLCRSPNCSYDVDVRYFISADCPPVRNLTYGSTDVAIFSPNELIHDAGNGYKIDQPILNLTNLIDRAVTQVWAKADQSSVAALVMLGECKETISSTANVLKKLVNIVKAIKKREYQFLIKETKSLGNVNNLADLYMGFRYMLRPLYYDMLGIIKAFDEHLSHDRFTFRSYVTETQTASYNEELQMTPELLFSRHYFATRTVSVRAGLLCHVDAPSMISIWGFDKPIEAFWDLVPYSFVIDWLINVGSTIASWTPEVGVKPLASWYVISDDTYYYNWADNARVTPISGRDYVSPKFTLENCYTSKQISTKARVINPVRAILPSFNLKLDALKLLDLVIMLRNLMKGK